MTSTQETGVPDDVVQRIDARLDALFAQAGDSPIIQAIRLARREELIAAAQAEGDA